MFVGKYLSTQTHLPVVSVNFPLPAQRQPCLIPGETIQYHDCPDRLLPSFLSVPGLLGLSVSGQPGLRPTAQIFSALTKVGNDKAVSS